MHPNEQKIISRADGYITIDIPAVQLPTPITAARWLVTSPAVRVLFYLLIGFAAGYVTNYVPPVIKNIPAPVKPETETLESFVARESKILTADERKKLIAVTEKVLASDFNTPSALREECYYQYLKSGLHDSTGFNAFWERFAELAENRRQTAEDSVESTRSIYESLVRGLKVQGYNDFLARPVEGFLHFPPSIINHPLMSDGDEPVSPSFLRASDGKQQMPVETIQQQRIFRRR